VRRSQLCCKCVANVLLMCCYCVANVLLMFCYCAANVLLMCCYCVANVLQSDPGTSSKSEKGNQSQVQGRRRKVGARGARGANELGVLSLSRASCHLLPLITS
jgi:hypothetical protein